MMRDNHPSPRHFSCFSKCCNGVQPSPTMSPPSPSSGPLVLYHDHEFVPSQPTKPPTHVVSPLDLSKFLDNADATEKMPPTPIRQPITAVRSPMLPSSISYPLVDPLKVKSKAKNPIVGPPPGVVLKPAPEVPPHLRLGSAALLQHERIATPTSCNEKNDCNRDDKNVTPQLRDAHSENVALVQLPINDKEPRKPLATIMNTRKTSFKDVVTKSTENAEAANKSKPSSLTLNRNLSLVQYGRLLRGYSANATAKSASQAETILREMILEGKVKPDGACFNSVIHAYAELGDAERAHSLLVLMFEEYKNGNPDAQPNVRVYTNVLHAWRKSKDPRAPMICEDILDSMHRLHDTGALPDCEPDAFAYTVLFHCWAESQRADASENAKRLFHKMKTRYQNGCASLQPDDIVYSNIINIFKESKDNEHMAEEILWEMVDDYQSGNGKAKPSIRNFNTVLAMYSKSKSAEAPDRAQAVVLRLLDLCEGSNSIGVRPDRYTYSLLLKTWVFNAKKSVKGANEAVECLFWLRDRYHKGDDAAIPDLIKYSTCINALARCGQAARAESLLLKMREDFVVHGNREAQPDSKLYETVINAWLAHDQIKVGAARAAALITNMWSLDKVGTKNVRPTIQIYKRVIIALKKAHRPDEAQILLEKMDYHHANGRLKEGPSKEMFQTVINAWGESRHEDRKEQMYQLEVKMHQRFRPARASPPLKLPF